MRVKIMYTLMSLALSWCAGCQSQESGAELAEFKTRSALEERNKELASRYIDAITEGNFEALENYLSDDYRIYSPSRYPEPTSREKLIENYKAASGAFSAFRWNVKEMIAAGDKVICRIMVTGTYTGAPADTSASGQEFQLSLITIMRMEQGRVVEEWQEDDQLGFARQLGMELKPKDE